MSWSRAPLQPWQRARGSTLHPGSVWQPLTVLPKTGPKTGFESQLFETEGEEASRASQQRALSKQAFGKFREEETGLNFPSDSPGGEFRLPGGVRTQGPWLCGRLAGGGPLGTSRHVRRHSVASLWQLVLGLGASRVRQAFPWSNFLQMKSRCAPSSAPKLRVRVEP